MQAAFPRLQTGCGFFHFPFQTVQSHDPHVQKILPPVFRLHFPAPLRSIHRIDEKLSLKSGLPSMRSGQARLPDRRSPPKKYGQS